MKGQSIEIDVKQIKKLEADLEFYDMNIGDDIEVANSYYMKAEILVKLSHLKGDESAFKEALKCYNSAIDLDAQNALYFAGRSKLYVEMGETELAVEDIRKVKELPKAGGIANIFLDHVVRDITKLDSVRDTIKDLASKGTIDAEFAKALTEHANVTAGLVVTVGSHGEKLDKHDEKIEELTSMVKKLMAGEKVSKKDINKLKEDQTAIQGKLEEHTVEISTINEQMTKLCTSEEFNKYAAESKTMFSMFGDKVKLVEAKVEGQEKMLVHIDDTLDKANIFNEVEIKDGFARLKSVYGPNTHEYAYKFYWIMSNYVLAHRMLSTGMIEGQAHKNQSSLFEKISTSIASTLGTALEAVPYAGNVIGVITGFIVDINNAYQGAKSDLIVKRVVDSLCGSMLDKDLNLAIANAAIKIAELKHEAINDPRAGKAEGKLGRAEEWISGKIDKLISKISKVKETYESVPSKLALEDVVLLVSLIVSSDEKLTQEGSNPKILGDRIADMLYSGADDELQKIYDSNNKSGKETKKETKSDKTTMKIFAATNVEYEDELLNNMELLERATKAFPGKMKLSKAIDLSQGLSHGLVKEAIDNGDIDTLVAGLMSLSDSSEL